jgi:uroporphyrinogen-III decarboxylase
MTVASQEFEARTKRVHDAIELKVPDRVPIIPVWQLLPTVYAGMTYEEAYYDVNRFLQANEEAILKYKPDLYALDEVVTAPGGALEALGTRQLKWPGHGVGANQSYQFVEGEYMKADEYDEFILDPSGFTFNKYLPRVFGALEPFALLPPPSSLLIGGFGAGLTALLDNPAVEASFEALIEASKVSSEWFVASSLFVEKMMGLGFPSFSGSLAEAPFDMLATSMRGMRGTMIDMYRQPEKLRAAMEKILMLQLPEVLFTAKESGNPRVTLLLFRGSDGFMSLEQFEEFYWPGTKSLILTLIDEGLTPCVWFEGVWDQRLEYLAELPEGKVLGIFERTDLSKASERLQGKMCIAGGMPITLLQTGSPEEIREHTRKTIEALGKDGGYIMACSTAMVSVPEEKLEAWVEATKEFGSY